MIYVDAGGRTIAHPVVCHEHASRRLARDKAARLKVYDDREGSSRLIPEQERCAT
jgi:hypothetical protein